MEHWHQKSHQDLLWQSISETSHYVNNYSVSVYSAFKIFWHVGARNFNCHVYGWCLTRFFLKSVISCLCVCVCRPSCSLCNVSVNVWWTSNTLNRPCHSKLAPITLHYLLLLTTVRLAIGTTGRRSWSAAAQTMQQSLFSDLKCHINNFPLTDVLPEKWLWTY